MEHDEPGMLERSGAGAQGKKKGGGTGAPSANKLFLLGTWMIDSSDAVICTQQSLWGCAHELLAKLDRS